MASSAMLTSFDKKRKELADGNERPQKKAALSGEASGGSDVVGASGCQCIQAFTSSEKGGGASLSPATPAPPASNLLARRATSNFRHEGGGKLIDVLREKVGGLFSLNAEYTQVKGRDVCDNGGIATLDNGGVPNGGVDDAAHDTKAAGVRRVLSRLEAIRAGQFVMNVQFDVVGDELRPWDLSVISCAEAKEADSSKSYGDSGIQASGDQWIGGARGGGSLKTMEGSKPWRTSNHAAFARVSSHAFKVSPV